MLKVGDRVKFVALYERWGGENGDKWLSAREDLIGYVSTVMGSKVRIICQSRIYWRPISEVRKINS